MQIGSLTLRSANMKSIDAETKQPPNEVRYEGLLNETAALGHAAKS